MASAGAPRERVLGRLLGEIPVAEEADQRGDGAAEVLAEGGFDRARSTGSVRTR